MVTLPPKPEHPTVRELMDRLGFDLKSDHDEAIRWALIELLLRRDNEFTRELQMQAWMRKRDRAYQERDEAKWRAETAQLRIHDAERLADEVDVLVQRKVIDARSPAADALLDFRGEPRSERSDRLVQLESEVGWLRWRLKELDK